MWCVPTSLYQSKKKNVGIVLVYSDFILVCMILMCVRSSGHCESVPGDL